MLIYSTLAQFGTNAVLVLTSQPYIDRITFYEMPFIYHPYGFVSNIAINIAHNIP